MVHIIYMIQIGLLQHFHAAMDIRGQNGNSLRVQQKDVIMGKNKSPYDLESHGGLRRLAEAERARIFKEKLKNGSLNRPWSRTEVWIKINE